MCYALLWYLRAKAIRDASKVLWLCNNWGDGGCEKSVCGKNIQALWSDFF